MQLILNLDNGVELISKPIEVIFGFGICAVDCM
jgi:hypothetical protein